MNTPIDTAVQARNASSRLSVLKVASLIDKLRSPGRTTLFTPGDAALQRPPAGSLDALFKGARTLKPFLNDQMMRGVPAANDF